MRHHPPTLFKSNSDNTQPIQQYTSRGIMLLRMKMVVPLALGIILFLHGCSAAEISRKSFPNGFVFGTASSAYQYEGAVKEDGRGPAIWDKFAHTFGKVTDFSNADVAVNQYHLYEGDIQLMKDMGMDAYRFSISWSRIFPNGSGEINQAGIDHYNALINSLLAHGIEPYVTLYHWDLPQALADKYNGWLDTQIINDFATYAETCFEKFGDRVKNWITFNEPHTFTVQGYDVGLQAPGRCSILLRLFCRAGNSATEPYIVAHNVLLSHAAAFDIYKRKYKARQHGRIGVAFDVMWYVAGSTKTEDIDATQRAQDFQLGWFLDPIMFGDYPSSMRTRVGDRLPRFSKLQSALLKGSIDFVGINHYTTWYAWHNSTSIIGVLLNDSLADSGSLTLPWKNGKAMGDRANSIWLYIVPEGFRSLLNYVKNKYGNPLVIVTESGNTLIRFMLNDQSYKFITECRMIFEGLCYNRIMDIAVSLIGMDDPNSPFISLKDALKDEKRVKYYNDYLTNLLAAIKEDGCNVKGYFAWSLLDNWEWAAGYSSRFGLYFVDYNDKLKRYAKDSAIWFKNFLTSG